jgi:hypothetical protein
MYRLFIDYPIAASSTEEAVSIASKILAEVAASEEAKMKISALGLDQINYRLGHDEDRQNRNYFVITDSGHASTKKTKIFLQPSDQTSV